MKKHEMSYHEHDDSISFYLDHCNHLNASDHFYSNQSTKKKIFFSKENLFDQSEIIENKKIKIFFEKTNNSKMILNKIEFNKRLNESRKKLIERRMNES
jgi:single-stranded DNA-specific DHH superfamily exonuclease